MKRMLVSLLTIFVLAWSLDAHAQYLTSLDQPPKTILQNATTSSSSNGLIMTWSGWFPIVGITASGTFSGATFTIQVSNDGTAWSNANCYTLDGGTNVNTAGWLTAAGNWRCNVSGFSKLQATINSGTPGGVTITAQASPQGNVRDTNNQLQTSQIRTNQSVAPTCSFGCGTSPSVTGADTAMTVTLGTSPASSATTAFEVFFNSTWAAAPACVPINATVGTGSAANYVTRVITTATEMRVNTAAGPSSSDKYAFICIGVQ